MLWFDGFYLFNFNFIYNMVINNNDKRL